MEATVRHRSVPVLLVGALVILFAATALLGGYLDWIWWHPTQSILTTLVAIGLLLVAGAALLFRRRMATRVAMLLATAGAGLLAGQLLGPVRPAAIPSEGTLVVRFDTPLAAEAGASALCQIVPDEGQLQVSGDPNARLPLPGVDAVARPFVSGTVYRGDMWAGGKVRDDTLRVLITVSAAVEDADGGPMEVRLESNASSQLAAQIGQDGRTGSLSFSGLEVTQGDVGSLIPGDGEVSGVIEWTCEER